MADQDDRYHVSREAGAAGLPAALDRICAEAEAAIDEGYRLVVLTDVAMNADRVPLSSLLACGAVHHHLVRRAKTNPDWDRLGIG